MLACPRTVSCAVNNRSDSCFPDSPLTETLGLSVCANSQSIVHGGPRKAPRSPACEGAINQAISWFFIVPNSEMPHSTSTHCSLLCVPFAAPSIHPLKGPLATSKRKNTDIKCGFACAAYSGRDARAAALRCLVSARSVRELLPFRAHGPVPTEWPQADTASLKRLRQGRPRASYTSSSSHRGKRRIGRGRAGKMAMWANLAPRVFMFNGAFNTEASASELHRALAALLSPSSGAAGEKVSHVSQPLRQPYAAADPRPPGRCWG